MDEIIQLTFKKKKLSTEVVEELLPTIDHYRAEGISLSSIHRALCNKQLLSIGHSSQMAFNTFKNVYYHQRKQDSVVTSKAALDLQRQGKTAKGSRRKKNASSDFAMSELSPKSEPLTLKDELPT